MEIFDNQHKVIKGQPAAFYHSTKYHPIKCVVIIYGYDADGYKGKWQIFAHVKTWLVMLK